MSENIALAHLSPVSNMPMKTSGVAGSRSEIARVSLKSLDERTQMTRSEREPEPDLVDCSVEDCTTTSRRAEEEAIPLRLGFSKCSLHLDRDNPEVVNRLKYCNKELDTSAVTIIFYHVGLDKNKEVVQLSAVASRHKSLAFSCPVKPSARQKHGRIDDSLVLGNMCMPLPLPSQSSAPGEAGALDRKEKTTHAIETHSSEETIDIGKIVLTAHSGSCNDHMHLIRTILSCGIKPPTSIRLSDTLPLFKTMRENRWLTLIRSLPSTRIVELELELEVERGRCDQLSRRYFPRQRGLATCLVSPTRSLRRARG
ncbi:uncharacterized protein BDV17DRAFT_288528 [Aspergillus undulatus]|uniref:uncharacterized protein n=1 Tax=Aspergillus undulatus TaxID=1810928 RepID=UPI003CCD2E31